MDPNVSSCMTPNPIVGSPEWDVLSALHLMERQDLRHLPVIDDDTLVGIVSVSDLHEALASPDGVTMHLSDVMKTAVYAVQLDTPLHQVVREMAELKCGSAVIINNEKKVMGLLTTTDALRLLVEILEEQSAESVDMEEYVEVRELRSH